MSEFNDLLDGLEGDDEQGLSGGQPAAEPGAADLVSAQTRIRELEAQSAMNASQAAQAAMQAQQATIHNQQWQQWAQNQQRGGNKEFELEGFDADKFLEDPKRAAEELQYMGTELDERAQRGIHNRVSPVEQAVSMGAQQLGQITNALNSRAVEDERREYAARGWNDFDEDYSNARSKFHQAGRLQELDSMMDAGKIDQVLMLERMGARKPVAGAGDRSKQAPPPAIGANPAVNPDVARGNLSKGHNAFLRSWDVDPTKVDLNSDAFKHLKTELGGGGR